MGKQTGAGVKFEEHIFLWQTTHTLLDCYEVLWSGAITPKVLLTVTQHTDTGFKKKQMAIQPPLGKWSQHWRKIWPIKPKLRILSHYRLLFSDQFLDDCDSKIKHAATSLLSEDKKLSQTISEQDHHASTAAPAALTPMTPNYDKPGQNGHAVDIQMATKITAIDLMHTFQKFRWCILSILWIVYPRVSFVCVNITHIKQHSVCVFADILPLSGLTSKI